MDKLLNLKNTNKVLYYILIPLVLIALAVKFLMDNNIIGAKKSLDDAEKKDIDLKAEQEEAERKAKELQDKANKHGEAAKKHEENADNVDVDEDWHLKE